MAVGLEKPLAKVVSAKFAGKVAALIATGDARLSPDANNTAGNKCKRAAFRETPKANFAAVFRKRRRQETMDRIVIPPTKVSS